MVPNGASGKNFIKYIPRLSSGGPIEQVALKPIHIMSCKNRIHQNIHIKRPCNDLRKKNKLMAERKNN